MLLAKGWKFNHYQNKGLLCQRCSSPGKMLVCSHKALGSTRRPHEHHINRLVTHACSPSTWATGQGDGWEGHCLKPEHSGYWGKGDSLKHVFWENTVGFCLFDFGCLFSLVGQNLNEIFVYCFLLFACETSSHCIILDDLKLTVQTRLAPNSQRSAWLCSAGIKGIRHYLPVNNNLLKVSLVFYNVVDLPQKHYFQVHDTLKESQVHLLPDFL